MKAACCVLLLGFLCLQVFRQGEALTDLQKSMSNCGAPSKTCLSYSNSYFFNEKSGKCEVIGYGGCPGSANAFCTIEDCKRMCVWVSM
ncbi:hypothetical protein BsWGS_23815 [Bradybaena similaris]